MLSHNVTKTSVIQRGSYREMKEIRLKHPVRVTFKNSKTININVRIRFVFRLSVCQARGFRRCVFGGGARVRWALRGAFSLRRGSRKSLAC